MFWTARAITEYHRAERTWFGTLTLSPMEHYVIDARAQARLGRSGVNWQQLSAKEQFAERAKELGAEATKFIKRLRFGSKMVCEDGPHIPHKPVIRYLLVAEMHDSAETSDEMRGRPHFHMLLHEQQAGALVVGKPLTALFAGRSVEMERRSYKTRRGWKPGVFAADNSFLRSNWTLGFTKFQLAESPMSAAYVCKYLTKALAVRVRASQGYGLENHNTEGKASIENRQRETMTLQRNTVGVLGDEGPRRGAYRIPVDSSLSNAPLEEVDGKD